MPGKASHDTDLKLQAGVFGSYLLNGKKPNDVAVSLYVKALSARPGKLKAADKKLLSFMLKHQWSIGYLDAGLALSQPMSELRRRLYIMFSVLESNPEYHQMFLPKDHGFLYLFVMGLSGLRAIFRDVAGWLLVKVVA